MAARYKTNRIFTDKLWQKDCPVLMEKGAFLYDTVKQLHLLQFKFRNLQSKVIESVYIEIKFPETEHDVSNVPINYRYQEIHAALHDCFGIQSPIYVIKKEVNEFQLTVKSVHFQDKSIWTGSTPLTPLPAPEFISSLGVYGETFIQEVHKLKAISCMNLPTDREEFWYCACGTVNGKDETHCINCSIPKEAIFQLKDPDFLKARKQEADTRQKLLEAEQEAERLKKLQTELENKKKRKKVLFRITAVCCSLVLLLGIGLLSVKVFYPEYRYNKAVSYMENRNYDNALQVFESLGDYKDSSKKLLETKYAYAGVLAENKDYDDALAYYNELNDSMDVGEEIDLVRYQLANDCVENGRYSDALKIYQDLADYKDCARRIPETKYLLANASMESKDYTTAYRLYTELGDYKDVPERITEAKYLLANASIESKDYTTAYQLYTELGDYKDVPERITEAKYHYADVLVDQGDYQEAVDLYKEIYNYKDSAELQKIANFKKAQKFFDQENYSECLFTLKKMFNSLKDIDGATELYNECKNRLWRQ